MSSATLPWAELEWGSAVTEARHTLLDDVSARSRAGELFEIFWGASEDNWDGRGASRVTLVTAKGAMKLLELLPDGPAPDITVEPDGAIGFVWRIRPHWVFVVSILDGRLTFAGLFGKGRRYRGAEFFGGDEIPETVIFGLREILEAGS